MPSTPAYHFEATASIARKPSHSHHSSKAKLSSSSTASTVSLDSSTSSATSSPFSSSTSTTASTPTPTPIFSTPTTRVHITGRLSPTPPLPVPLHTSPSPTPSITALADIWRAYQHQRSLVTSLTAQLTDARHSASLASAAHRRYQREVFDSIAKLKADFVSAQAGYEKALEGFRRRERERGEELRVVRTAIQGYRDRLSEVDLRGEEEGVVGSAGEGGGGGGGEGEEKVQEEGDGGGVDFEADVKLVSRRAKKQSSSRPCKCSDCDEDL